MRQVTTLSTVLLHRLSPSKYISLSAITQIEIPSWLLVLCWSTFSGAYLQMRASRTWKLLSPISIAFSNSSSTYSIPFNIFVFPCPRHTRAVCDSAKKEDTTTKGLAGHICHVIQTVTYVLHKQAISLQKLLINIE